jgi:hypothetical protein
VRDLAGVYVRLRLYILSRIIIVLSIPVVLFSCRNIARSSSGKKIYEPRTVVSVKDTIISDSIPDPVFFDPVPQCDYGVIYTDTIPVYYDPAPIAEYGVVYPFDEEPDN